MKAQSFTILIALLALLAGPHLTSAQQVGSQGVAGTSSVSQARLMGGISDGGGCMVMDRGQPTLISLAEQNRSLVVRQGQPGERYQATDNSYVAGFSYLKKEELRSYHQAHALLVQRQAETGSLVAEYWANLLESMDFLYTPYKLSAKKHSELLSCPQSHLNRTYDVEMAMFFTAPQVLNFGIVTVNLPVFNQLTFDQQVALFLHDSARELKNWGRISDETLYELVRSIMQEHRQGEDLDEIVNRLNGQESRLRKMTTRKPSLKKLKQYWCSAELRRELQIPQSICEETSYRKMLVALERHLHRTLTDPIYDRLFVLDEDIPEEHREIQALKDRLKELREYKSDVYDALVFYSYWKLQALDKSPMMGRVLNQMKSINAAMDHYLKTYNGSTGQMRVSPIQFLKAVENDELGDYKSVYRGVCQVVRNHYIDTGWLIPQSGDSVPSCPHSLSSGRVSGARGSVGK